LACVKEHNAKYVFVSGDKMYNVSNQDFAALQEHAGHTVKLTGAMSGDSMTVSKIAMPVTQEEKLSPTVANEAHTEAS
jgi:hypothetical protein